MRISELRFGFHLRFDPDKPGAQRSELRQLSYGKLGAGDTYRESHLTGQYSTYLIQLYQGKSDMCMT